MRRIGRGLLCAMALCLAAFAAAPGAILADRWSEPPGDKQGEIAKLLTEKAKYTGAIRQTEKGITQAGEERDRWLEELKKLRDLPSREEVGIDLKRPEKPNRDDYDSTEEYIEAMGAWEKATAAWYENLSEEDRARWDEAAENDKRRQFIEDNFKTLRAAVLLLDARRRRLARERKSHCVENPVERFDDDGLPVKEPEEG